MMDATPYPLPARARVAMMVLTVAYMLSFIDRQILSLLVEPTYALPRDFSGAA
jgi:hypothetical protein